MELMDKEKYRLIGLTGGVATGKTTVSDEMKKLGAKIIDADLLAREIVKKGLPAWSEIQEHFGSMVFNTDDSINRSALADIIFSNEEKKKLLEKITHPRIIAEQNRIIQTLAKKSYSGLIVIDAALLIESGYYKKMDKIIVVYCSKKVQKERLMKRNNLSEEKAIKRINAQMPISEKLKYAHFIINNTTREKTALQTGKIYQTFCK